MAFPNHKNKTGNRVPSVTGILANLGWPLPGLMYWAWDQGMHGINYRDTSQRAADAGTCAHQLIEWWINDHTPTPRELAIYPEDVYEKGQTALLNFIQWAETVHFTVLETECAYTSEEYQFGGKIDCVASVNDRRVILDWKSGSGVYPNMWIQGEAYRHLWDECRPDEPIEDGIYILRIDKETVGFDWHYRFSIPEAWEAFLLLRKLHELKSKIK